MSFRRTYYGDILSCQSRHFVLFLPWGTLSPDFWYVVTTVNDVIADKNVVTEITNKYTGLQRIELNGFAKRHWKIGYYPFVYGWCLGLCWVLGLYQFLPVWGIHKFVD